MELGRALGRRSIALFVSLAMVITLTPQSAYAETLDEDQAYEQLEAVEEGDTSDLLLVDDTASDADQNGSTDDVVDGEDAEEKASGEQEDAASNDAVDDVLDIEGLTDDSSSEGATSEVPNEEDDEASSLDIEDMPTEGEAVQEDDEPIALLGSSAAGYTWPLRSAGTVFNGFTSDHGGIDIVIPEGSDVLAAMGGTVKYIHRYNALTSRDDTTMNSYGMLVILYHDNGTTTYYAHLRDIAVSEGQRVSQGAVIGHVGLTGNTTGYHLHFELRTGANAALGNTGTGTRQNPLNYVSPSNLFEGTSGSNPIGFVDGVEGRDGKVYIWGWAYDPDDPYAAVQVHVYIGGPSGVGEGHNGIMANLPRQDVNNVMGIVGNHGFETVINTNRRGPVDIHAYAMNIGGGDTNPQLVNVFTVTVTNPKVITKIWTSDVTFAGYYINCNINPDVGAARVQFPTWTVYNSQDDLAPEWWSSSATAGKKVNSTTWRYYVKTSDHNEERGDYVTHIYVYDANGNTIEQFTSGIGMNVKPGDVSKATVSAISNKQYTGKAISPKPTVKLSGTALKLNTDYTLSYKNNVKAGTASVIIKGKGRCTGTKTVTFKIVTPGVTYRTHVQNIGWQGWKKNGAMSGTSGQALRLEGINIKLENKPISGGITYRTHVQNIGWQGWRSDGAMSGTSGQALRLEAIQIKLTGKMAEKYDVYYRVHCQNIGWMGWAKNGQSAGSAGYAYRLEGIQVVLVPKGKSAPSATYKGITANTKQRFSQR